MTSKEPELGSEPQRWYNSHLVNYAGVSLIIGAALIGIGSCSKLLNEGIADKIRAENQAESVEFDFNNNGIIDKFYRIDGTLVPYEIDGQSVIDLYE